MSKEGFRNGVLAFETATRCWSQPPPTWFPTRMDGLFLRQDCENRKVAAHMQKLTEYVLGLAPPGGLFDETVRARPASRWPSCLLLVLLVAGALPAVRAEVSASDAHAFIMHSGVNLPWINYGWDLGFNIRVSPTYPNGMYRVDACNDLTIRDWQTVTNVSANPDALSMWIAIPGCEGSRRFFRVGADL